MAFELQRFGTLGGRAANIYARVSICVRVRVKVGQDAAAWFISDLNVFRMRRRCKQLSKANLETSIKRRRSGDNSGQRDGGLGTELGVGGGVRTIDGWKWVQSNPLNGSPDNGSIRLLVQVLASPMFLSKICWFMVQSDYWFNFWSVPLRNH